MFNKNGAGTLVLNESSSSMVGATGINVNAGTLLVNGTSIGPSTMSGVVTNGSTVITGLASTAGLRVGQQISGLNAGNYPVILSIDSASQVSIAAPVTSASGTPNLTFAAVGGLGYNSGNVNVAANATLGGSGTLVLAASRSVTINSAATLTGTLTINGDTNISGIHAPGNSPGVQNFNGDLTYNSGAAVNWELTGNTVSGRGINYDGINVNGAGNDLNFAGNTTLNLSFNGPGSNVLWTDSHWGLSYEDTNGWLLYDVFSSITNFSNLSLNQVNWLDSSGNALSTMRDASFSLVQIGNDIYLNYTVIPAPEPSSFCLLGLGALSVARRVRRRGVARA